MAIAALYPLWGALVGIASVFLLPVDLIVIPWPNIAMVLFLWLLVAVIEQRVLQVPLGLHILGAVVLCLCWSLVLHYRGVSQIQNILVTQVVCRAAAIAFVWVSRPDGNGMDLSRKMNSYAAGIGVACGLVVVLGHGIRHAILVVLAGFLVLRVLREWCYKRYGGINPAAASLAQHAVALATLLILVLQP